MEKLRCNNCGTHLGYIVDCGPRGWVQCDCCYEKDKQEEQQEEDDE